MAFPSTNSQSGEVDPPAGIGEDWSERPVREADSCTIDHLLQRMRSGDRDAAAAFIVRYGSRVRRRVRGKLGPAMRRVFDSEEILSTVGRRLDLYVRSGRLEAEAEGQLWNLIFKMADCAAMEKMRVFHRLERVEAADSDFAREFLWRLQQADRQEQFGVDKTIEQALRILTNDLDRKILACWLAGHDHALISEELELSATAVRKRWQCIKEMLREHLAVHDE